MLFFIFKYKMGSYEIQFSIRSYDTKIINSELRIATFVQRWNFLFLMIILCILSNFVKVVSIFCVCTKEFEQFVVYGLKTHCGHFSEKKRQNKAASRFY